MARWEVKPFKKSSEINAPVLDKSEAHGYSADGELDSFGLPKNAVFLFLFVNLGHSALLNNIAKSARISRV